MKLNIANQASGYQKVFELEDEQKIKLLFDRRIAEEVVGDEIGDQFKGYIFRITGGNDKQGFPMMQGVATQDRVRLLLGENHNCFNRYRGQKRKGVRKRKSVRGCITSQDNSVISMVIVKTGDADIPGLSEDGVLMPRRLGPKRANNIRKIWDLEKEDDPRLHVIRRTIELKDGSKRKKPKQKAPKIQRLVTPQRVAHKAYKAKLAKRKHVKSRDDAAAYAKLLAAKRAEARSKRQSKLSKRRSKQSKK